jgi:hypothetical protein
MIEFYFGFFIGFTSVGVVIICLSIGYEMGLQHNKNLLLNIKKEGKI